MSLILCYTLANKDYVYIAIDNFSRHTVTLVISPCNGRDGACELNWQPVNRLSRRVTRRTVSSIVTPAVVSTLCHRHNLSAFLINKSLACNWSTDELHCNNVTQIAADLSPTRSTLMACQDPMISRIATAKIWRLFHNKLATFSWHVLGTIVLTLTVTITVLN